MRRYALCVRFFSVLLVLVGCIKEYKPTAAEFFRDKMNLDPLPPGISDFRKANYEEPPYAAEGYFTYQASPSFMEALLMHNKFFKDFQRDPSNQAFTQIPCSQIYYQTSPAWADELSRISMADKRCYKGIFLPYSHTLVYDPQTQTVDHFFYAIGP